MSRCQTSLTYISALCHVISSHTAVVYCPFILAKLVVYGYLPLRVEETQITSHYFALLRLESEAFQSLAHRHN